jgi:hypothetical protein
MRQTDQVFRKPPKDIELTKEEMEDSDTPFKLFGMGGEEDDEVHMMRKTAKM